MSCDVISAAVLLIGDELLRGQTQDSNLRVIAGFLADRGIEVTEARVVGDTQDAIVLAVNDLRARHDYVITTGGIGPTHDDKTADAIAIAFGVGIGLREDAHRALSDYYGERGVDEISLRMARIPDGARLIHNPVSGAPGFALGNVCVLAGVPEVMKAMLESAGTYLSGGAVMLSASVRANGLLEGDIAAALGDLEAEGSGHVVFGSYPWFSEREHGVRLVARSRDWRLLDQSIARLTALVRDAGATPELEDGGWRVAR